jgi:hypothetical protein
MVGFLVFDLLYRHLLLLTATVGGVLIGSGLDLADRRVAWIIAGSGTAVGAALGLAMWLTGPGRKIAQGPLWVAGSAVLVVVWLFLALALFAAVQKLLTLAGGWEGSPLRAVLGGGVGFVIGGGVEELWWQQKRRGSSSAHVSNSPDR